MLRSGGAVIHMQLNFSELTYVIGNADTVEQMLQLPALQPFSNEIITFLNALSRKLLKTGKAYSDVMTFGFWCRRAALLKEKDKYTNLDRRLGRGIIFHSTPSNVAVNFAFSFATGLLAGNANIVRLPEKPYAQVDIICQAVDELLKDDFVNLAPYICVIKFPPVREITDVFSSICDTRVIWGGDMTVAELRKSPLKARANEVTFADRHSIAAIDADEYLKAEDKERIAQDFYNDTYFTDQNACTSPCLIVWLGKDKEKAKKEFWERTHALVKEKYSMAAVQSVGKLSAFYRVAVQKEGIKLIESEDNLVTRVACEIIDKDLSFFKYNSGFFFEYDADSLNEMLPICTEPCQTLTYYGVSKQDMLNFVSECRPRGIDRIVPMGKSMDFSLVWDGYDLIRSLSRELVIN